MAYILYKYTAIGSPAYGPSRYAWTLILPPGALAAIREGANRLNGTKKDAVKGVVQELVVIQP